MSVSLASPPLPAFARFDPQQACERLDDAMCDGELLPLLMADDFILQALQGNNLSFGRAWVRQLDERRADGGATHGAQRARMGEVWKCATQGWRRRDGCTTAWAQGCCTIMSTVHRGARGRKLYPKSSEDSIRSDVICIKTSRGGPRLCIKVKYDLQDV
jgi:hypothetical protein